MAAEDQLNNLGVQFEQARLPTELTGPGWKARGDRTPTDKRVPFNRPTAKQANQFILSVRRDNCCIYQKVLCAADVVLSGQQLSAWDFSFPKKDLHYRYIIVNHIFLFFLY
ncbi:hypothetical protein ANCDUO_04887 [Ancylostoma duodenale]|uniref:Uncharacterized protein n=1 Tax=Ancylostoma duodenale TaxID=51022 RepID=A0A0C2H5T4_9BILA|nr:hypothetical protein ANCDUO_04887 [Ancylostoma duodenale]